MTLLSWLSVFTIKRAHLLHSKSLHPLSPRASIQSSLLGFE
jgi:hypothetical protein